MQNQRPLLLFAGALTLVLSIVFTLHYGFFAYQKIDISFTDLFFPYLANYLLATAITTTLYLVRIKFATSLGFIFMASSFLKFTLYLVVFNPIYNLDGDVTPLEFGLFFIPYAISLTVETTFLVRVLNRM